MKSKLSPMTTNFIDEESGNVFVVGGLINDAGASRDGGTGDQGGRASRRLTARSGWRDT
jgi:hypothetical protein